MDSSATNEQLELFSRFLMSQEGMMAMDGEHMSAGQGKRNTSSIPFYMKPNFQLGMASFLFVTSIICIRNYSHLLA